MKKHAVWVAVLAWSCFHPASPLLAQPIFVDGFESANTLAWSASSGDPTLVAPDPFRFSDLDLRDPHVFLDLPIFGCFDFTDQDLPLGLGESLNGQIEASIAGDADGDNQLDASFLLLFRPFSNSANNVRFDSGGGNCTVPMASTACSAVAGAPPVSGSYDAQAAGLCLDTLPGTTSGYTPGIAAPNGPCFVSASRSGVLDLGGLEVPLADLQVAAAFGAAPVDTLSSGLMRGFLSEAAADAILLPADLPVVGGQPLSILLPGGQGNCASHDARDTHNAESGWFFYLSYGAARVPYSGQ